MPKKRVVFNNAQMQRIWRATKAYELRSSARPVDELQQPEDPIFFRNDSGQTIPPYGLMQIETTLDIAGSYNLALVQRPIHSSLMRCPLLINNDYEVLNGGFGMAQSGPVYRLLHDGGSYVAGDRLGAKTSTFTATYGALFAVLGSDNVATNIVRVMFDTSAFKGKTKGVALVVGTPANVYYTDAAGTITTKEYLAETDVSNIPAHTVIDLFPMYGRLVAREVC
jgi:hypothetical protein